MPSKIQKIGVTAFIINGKSEVLIVKRAKNESFLPGYHELPGGKVEFGETCEQALIREIKEEIDLDIEIIKPYSTFSYVSANNEKHTIDIQYIVKKLKNDPIKLSEEHEEYRWVSQNKIDNYFEISDEMRKVILKGFKALT